MKKKLTLTVDEDLIKKGKVFSAQNDTSISEILEKLLLNMDKVIIKNGKESLTLYDLYINREVQGL